MASWRMRAVAVAVRPFFKRRFASAAAGRRLLAQAKAAPAPTRAVTGPHRVERRRVLGRDVYVVRPGRAAAPPSRHALVYVHGGAYTSPIVKEHWALIGHLAARTGCDVHVPLYGLAPAHHGLEALDLVTAVIGELSGDGRACYLVGASSGGGLALLATQASPRGVAGLTVIAPWLDLSMGNPGIAAVEPHDPWLSRAGLRPIADAWAHGLPLTDPRLSPLYGDVDRLPPLQVLVGTRDITVADCRALRDRIPAGAPLTYHEEPGAIHAYPMLPVPEAARARRAIVDHVRAALPAA